MGISKFHSRQPFLTREMLNFQQEVGEWISGLAVPGSNVQFNGEGKSLTATFTLPKISCRCFMSANFLTVAAVETIDLVLGAEDFDTANMHAAGSAQIVAVVAGPHIVSASMLWIGGLAGDREVRIYKNGAMVQKDRITGAIDPQQNVTAHLNMAIGDFVTMRAFRTGGGAASVVGGLSNQSSLALSLGS